jgi:HEAT repeat protein
MSEVRFSTAATLLASVARLGFSAVLLISLPCTDRAQQRPSIDGLLQQFENTRVFWQQFEVAKAIVAAHDPSVLPKLEPWLKADDRHLRGNAAFLFAGLGDARGFDVITAILNDRSKRGVGQGASYMPGGLGETMPPKVQIGADRYYAAHLLGDLRDPRGVPILVPLLKDREVWMIVPWSLGQIGDRSAIQPLIEALSSPDADMRILATYGLEELKATEALPRLRELLDDNQRNAFGQPTTVAAVARAAITKLEPLLPTFPQR